MNNTVYFEGLETKYLLYMGLILVFRALDIILTILGIVFFDLTEQNILLNSLNSNLFIGILVMVLANIAFLATFHLLFLKKRIGYITLKLVLIVFVGVVVNNTLKIFMKGGIL